MGTTIDDVKYDMYIQEKWEDERKEVFRALKKISNSRNTNELVKNLKGLKNVYISDKPVGSENLNKAISEINFDLLKATKHTDKQFEKFNKSSEKSDKKYFIYNSMVAVVVMFIGIIIGFVFCSVK